MEVMKGKKDEEYEIFSDHDLKSEVEVDSNKYEENNKQLNGDLMNSDNSTLLYNF